MDVLREQILSKNLRESPRTGNTFTQLSEDNRTSPASRFSTPPFCALYLGGANISSAKCYFFVPGYLTLCLSVSASVSYILRLCKGCLTFSICKLLTFSGLKCVISLYFAQTFLRNAKLARSYQKQRNFALNTRGALKSRRFSSPDLARLKCYAFLRPTPKRAAAPWGVGERDG